MLLDQHQDVVDVHLNLFDQLDLEDEVLVDGFLVSGVVLAHLLVEVQVGAAVVLDVARGFPMTPSTRMVPSATSWEWSTWTRW